MPGKPQEAKGFAWRSCRFVQARPGSNDDGALAACLAAGRHVSAKGILLKDSGFDRLRRIRPATAVLGPSYSGQFADRTQHHAFMVDLNVKF